MPWTAHPRPKIILNFLGMTGNKSFHLRIMIPNLVSHFAGTSLLGGMGFRYL